MRPALKKSLHWLGGSLAIAGIGFVVLRLRDYGGQMDFSRFGLKQWAVISGFALVYGISNLMLAQAWRSLLDRFGTHVTWRWAIKTYGVSQLAKYVPGNIFHLAGRQAIGMAAGVPGWHLAKSSIWELGLLTLAGAVYGVLALPLVISSVPASNVVFAFVLTVSAAAALLGHASGRPVARAFVWHVSFFAVSAALFAALIKLVSSLSLADASLWFALGGAYVLAWLAGFVTPGAPAGVGVRELVLLFLLQGRVSGADLLLAIVLGRAITVSGDGVFFVLASLLKGGKNIRVD
ncbi:MAG: hypothetical protein WB870_14465 [Gallionellaceae bacterium]